MILLKQYFKGKPNSLNCHWAVHACQFFVLTNCDCLRFPQIGWQFIWWIVAVEACHGQKQKTRVLEYVVFCPIFSIETGICYQNEWIHYNVDKSCVSSFIPDFSKSVDFQIFQHRTVPCQTNWTGRQLVLASWPHANGLSSMASGSAGCSDEWTSALRWLVTECLQSVDAISKDSIRKPFTLPFKEWLGILVSTCSRLGWVSESSSSERSLKTGIAKASSVLNFQDRNLLTFANVIQILEEMMSKQGQLVSRCPAGMWRESENFIVDSLRKRVANNIANSNVLASASSSLQVAALCETASQSPPVSTASSVSSRTVCKRLSFSPMSLASSADVEQMVSRSLFQSFVGCAWLVVLDGTEVFFFNFPIFSTCQAWRPGSLGLN